jgi:tol-pal system protein YbgF
MKEMNGRWMKAAVAAIVFAGVAGAIPSATAAAQTTVQTIDARELVTRLQRLERDMRDLQAETFRKGGAAAPAGAAVAPQAPPPSPPMEQSATPDLNPMMRRLGDLEESLGRLTGQMEELGHQVDQLTQKNDRLQKQLDLAEQARATAAVVAESSPKPAEGGNEIASLMPDLTSPVPRGAPPRNLGQLPAGAPLPAPAAKSDAKGEFDAAMNLLSRAQYDKASEAFRSFADAHPDEDRAADALYWTGDIAYSAMKDYPEAARDFAELLKKYPKAQRAPEGMLKLGLSLFELGQMKEGCAALAALPAKYPESTAAVATRAKTERTNKKCK